MVIHHGQVVTVPSAHKPVSQLNTTDPRRRADFTFMDKVRDEKERRSTFYDWPQGAWQHPTALAAAGFFYTGSADRVQCAFCRGILRNWEPNDVPIVEHEKHFGHCPFVKGRAVGNIPVPLSNNKPGTNVSQENKPHHANGFSQTMVQGSEIITQKPKNPDFALEAVRIRTFNCPTWPSETVHQSPVQLARAGFYYTGFADHVKCFYCDGGLRNWEPQDDPWEEHVKWFPRCPYTHLLGKEVTNRQPQIKSHKQMSNSDENKSQENGTITEIPACAQNGEYEELMRQNEEMKEQRICKVCMDNDINLVFLPCAHLVCCASCAPALKHCPICRTLIEGTVRVFMA